MIMFSAGTASHAAAPTAGAGDGISTAALLLVAAIAAVLITAASSKRPIVRLVSTPRTLFYTYVVSAAVGYGVTFLHRFLPAF